MREVEVALVRDEPCFKCPQKVLVKASGTAGIVRVVCEGACPKGKGELQ